MSTFILGLPGAWFAYFVIVLLSTLDLGPGPPPPSRHHPHGHHHHLLVHLLPIWLVLGSLHVPAAGDAHGRMPCSGLPAPTSQLRTRVN